MTRLTREEIAKQLPTPPEHTFWRVEEVPHSSQYLDLQLVQESSTALTVTRFLGLFPHSSITRTEEKMLGNRFFDADYMDQYSATPLKSALKILDSPKVQRYIKGTEYVSPGAVGDYR